MGTKTPEEVAQHFFLCLLEDESGYLAWFRRELELYPWLGTPRVKRVLDLLENKREVK